MRGRISGRRAVRLGMAAVILACLGIRVAGAWLARPTPTDVETLFLPSAKIALAGHPLHVYQVRLDEFPNANGPLGMVPLTLAAALGAKLGILDDRVAFRVLLAVLFAVFPLLLAREALLGADLLLGAPLRGVRRVLAFAALALGPEAVLSRGHLEQPLMLLLLLGSVRSLTLRRPVRGGLLFGAALLTRTSTLLYLAPLSLLLVAARRWREVLRFGGCALLCLVLGLLPFLIADRANVVYSLFTAHRALPSLGGSLWEIVPGSALSALGGRWDGTLAMAASLLLSAVLVARVPGLRLGSRGGHALLAACGLLLPLLMKSVWAYYYVDAFVLLAVFWLSGAGELDGPKAVRRWLAGALLPAAALLAGVTAAHALRSHGRSWTPGWSLTMTLVTALLLALVAAAAWRAATGKPAPPGAREGGRDAPAAG